MRFWVLIVALLLTHPLRGNGAELPLVDIDLHQAVFSDKLTQHSVGQSFQDSRGALWFVTQEGLNKYNGHELENYQFSANDPDSLPTNNITRMAEDNQGHLWFSSRGAGLISYNSVSNRFEALYTDPNNNNTPHSNDIRTVFSDSSGTLWLGYLNSFSKFDPEERSFHHFVSGVAGIPIVGEVGGFTETSDGAIWASTQLSGLLRIDPTANDISIHAHDSDGPNNI